MGIVYRPQRFYSRYRQMAADINGLLDLEGSTAKRVAPSELYSNPMQVLLAWHMDVCKRRLAAGLPEHVELKDSDG